MTTTIDTVEFLGKALTLITTDTQQLVAMRPICEGIGLDWKAQLDRIKRDEVLSTSVVMMTTQLPGDTQTRSVACLPLEMLNGWLFGVDTRRCRQAIRPALIRYKTECYAALAAHWQKTAAPTPATPVALNALAHLRLTRILFTLDGHGRPQAKTIPDDAGIVRPADLHHWIEDPLVIEPEALPRLFLAVAQRMFAAGQTMQMTEALRTVCPELLLVDAADLNHLRRTVNLSLQSMLNEYAGAPDTDEMFRLEGTKDKGPRYE